MRHYLLPLMVAGLLAAMFTIALANGAGPGQGLERVRPGGQPAAYGKTTQQSPAGSTNKVVHSKLKPGAKAGAQTPKTAGVGKTHSAGKNASMNKNASKSGNTSMGSSSNKGKSATAVNGKKQGNGKKGKGHRRGKGKGKSKGRHGGKGKGKGAGKVKEDGAAGGGEGK